jgi:hypothetical protein
MKRMPGEQGFAGQCVAGFARGLDQHRLAAERGEDMAIRRITGHRDRNAIARFEHRKKAQDKCARRAGGDHDPRRIHRAAVGLKVMPGDALAQRGNTKRRGVIDPRAVERRVGGRYRRFRRRSRRLPDFHVNDMAAGRLDARRRRHHVHHHERRNIASPRRGQKALGTLSQCRFQHRYLLFHHMPQTSRNPRFVRAYRLSGPPPII